MKEEMKSRSEAETHKKFPITDTYTEFAAEFFEDDYVSEVTKAIQEAYSQNRVDRGEQIKEEKKNRLEAETHKKFPITDTYTEFATEFFEDDYVSEVTKAIQEAFNKNHIDK